MMGKIGVGGGLLLGGFIVWLVFVMCLVVAHGQTSIEENTDRFQIDSSIGTGPGKILTYSKFIGHGEPGTTSMESVASVLTRLLNASSGNVALTIEFSADNASWHSVYNSASDRYFRWTVGTGSPSPGVEIHETGQEIVSKLSALTGNDRLDYSALKNVPTHPGQLTPLEIVAALAGLSGSERLSYTALKDTPDALTSAEVVLLLTALTGGDRLPISAVDTTGITIQWSELSNVPVYATRWPTLSEVGGLQQTISDLFETWGISIPEPPHWHQVPRKWLRRSSAFSLDLNTQILGTARFSVPASGDNALPAGLTLATSTGIISGTPTTEGVKFVDITATNSDGASTLRVPFIVLRDVSFDSGKTNLTGLAIKDGNLHAIDSTMARIYSWDKHGASVDSSGIAISDVSGVFTAVGSTGLTWDGNHYVVLSGPNRNGFSDTIAKFDSSGGYDTGSAVSPRQTLGAEGIGWDGTNYWVTARQGIGVYDVVTKLGSTLNVVPGQFRLDTSIEPRGLVIWNSNLYVVDDASDSVKVFDTSGNTNAAQTYREFDLDDDNHEPTGLAYLDGYYYVIEKGQGAVHDSVFIYPNRETQDLTVPEIDKIELARKGPFRTGDIIRPKITFSGEVDITVDVRFLLQIGDQLRQAIPVASALDSTASALDNVTVANFYYQVVADDTDADGITTPRFPFYTAGNMQHHGDTLGPTVHSMNMMASVYRVVSPGGVNALVPHEENSVNSIPQSDWNETDTTARDFIRNKPTDIITGWQNRVSLGEFTWVRDDSDGIQYDATGTRYTSLNIGTVSAVQDWAPLKSFAKGQTILVRVPLAGLMDLPGIYAEDIGYENDLSHMHSDSDNWYRFNGGSAYQGYFYYALKAQTSQAGSVFSAVRKIDASHVSNIPSGTPDWGDIQNKPTIPAAQEPSDWDATTGVTRILNKPAIEFLERGTATFDITEVSGSQEADATITPSAGLLAEAVERGSKVHVTVTVPWRTKQSSTVLADVEFDIERVNTPGGNLLDRDPTSDGATGSIPKNATGYQAYRVTLNVDPAATSYEVEVSLYNNNLGTLELGTVAYEFRLNRDLPLEGSDSITVANDRISVSDGGITSDMLDADTSTKQQGFRDTIDISATNTSVDATGFDGNLTTDDVDSVRSCRRTLNCQKAAFRDRIGAGTSSVAETYSAYGECYCDELPDGCTAERHRLDGQGT